MAEPVGEGSQLPLTISDGELVAELLERVVVRQNAVEIVFNEEDRTVLTLPWSLPSTTRRREILRPDGHSTSERPIRSETRARLVEGIVRGRLWLRELVAGEVLDTKEIAAREGCSDRFVRMTLSLAFLNPRLVKAAVDGRLPHAAGSAAFFDAPTNWSECSPGGN
jgi:hypothetical protein